MNEQQSSLQVDWYKVGWVKSAHGIKGELYVQLFSKKADWLADFKIFALKPKIASSKICPQTFEIQRVKPHKQGLIILPVGFSNRNQSEAVKGSDVFIDRSILTSKEGEVPYLVEFEGFQVKDLTLGDIGNIVGFEDNGAQDLLVVKTSTDQEVLIPFVDAFIELIDKQQKLLVMNLPEGLVE